MTTKAALNNRQLIVMALFEMGGMVHAVDTEDLAMNVANLDPQRFRWKKYPEQINLEAVRLAVKNLLSDRPQLVTGSMRNGWMLTPMGIEWCKRALGVATEENDLADEANLNALQRTSAFQKYKKGEISDITLYDVRGFLRIDEYSSARRRRERCQAVVNAATKDPDLSGLIDYIRSRFPEEWI